MMTNKPIMRISSAISRQFSPASIQAFGFAKEKGEDIRFPLKQNLMAIKIQNEYTRLVTVAAFC